MQLFWWLAAAACLCVGFWLRHERREGELAWRRRRVVALGSTPRQRVPAFEADVGADSLEPVAAFSDTLPQAFQPGEPTTPGGVHAPAAR